MTHDTTNLADKARCSPSNHNLNENKSYAPSIVVAYAIRIAVG